MKGIVFTEFLEMCEASHGLMFTNKLIIDSDLKSNGAYTSVGTYDHGEIFKLVKNLSERTGVPEDQLFQDFGKHLFTQFFKLYPLFFESIEDPFVFLESVDKHIHKEVIKLYPDAQLPKFQSEVSNNRMTMTYSSPRNMSSFAKGLIIGCMEHYNTGYTMNESKTPEGNTVFQILKK